MENSRVETTFSYGKISIIKNFCFKLHKIINKKFVHEWAYPKAIF